MSIDPSLDGSAGILSQTLASSPYTNSVFPAKIRTAANNDVVFVGHSSIHLRELTELAQLTKVLAHLELGVRILAAEVISAESEVITQEDAIFAQDVVKYTINGDQCPSDQPPQIVVLSIATGELIFLYARTLLNGHTNFVYARRKIHRGIPWASKYGKHLAVDPK